MKSLRNLALALFLISALCCSAQKNYKKTVNATDSTRIKTLFGKAFQCELYDPERQLYLDSIIQIQPNNAYAWQQKAMPLFKQKKYEAGMKYLDLAVQYDKTYKWLEYRAFLKCIFQKNYTAAITDLRAAEKRNPGGIVMDHSYDFYMGLCFLQLTRNDSAEKYIRKSIQSGITRVKEGHHLEYLYLGITLMEMQNYEEALTVLDRTIKLYPRFADAKFYKAKCLLKTGRQKESIALLKEADADLKAGYTINEDNVVYEDYPYQVKKEWINARLVRQQVD
jgi:tetratricopeptide (TPR) repeat protein